jgi:hypothetical protein
VVGWKVPAACILPVKRGSNFFSHASQVDFHLSPINQYAHRIFFEAQKRHALQRLRVLSAQYDREAELLAVQHGSTPEDAAAALLASLPAPDAALDPRRHLSVLTGERILQHSQHSRQGLGDTALQFCRQSTKDVVQWAAQVWHAGQAVLTGVDPGVAPEGMAKEVVMAVVEEYR